MKLTLIQRAIEYTIRMKVKYNLQPTYNYKAGDKVKYNWKAKAMILSAIESDVDDLLIVCEAIHSRNEFIRYVNTRTNEEGWVDAYWIRRVR